MVGLVGTLRIAGASQNDRGSKDGADRDGGKQVKGQGLHAARIDWSDGSGRRVSDEGPEETARPGRAPSHSRASARNSLCEKPVSLCLVDPLAVPQEVGV